MAGINRAAFGDVVAIAVVFHESCGGLHFAGRGVGIIILFVMGKMTFDKMSLFVKEVFAPFDCNKTVFVAFSALVIIVCIGTGLLPAGLCLAALGCSMSRNHGQRKNKKHRQNCDSDIDFLRVFLNHNAFVIALS